MSVTDMLLLTTQDESIESEAATWADTLCYAPADIKFKLPRKPPPREIPHAVITVTVVARAAGGATRAWRRFAMSFLSPPKIF
ncbi:MAG: hypothetical protein WBF73_25290 [Bradyrhizobium sp.]